MITSNFVVLLIAIGLVLQQGCTSEESVPKSSGQDKVNMQSSNYSKEHAISNNTPQAPPEVILKPSRSELRVMSEETKATEEQAKNVIEQFDKNLNNPEQRKVVEAKFKNMLPDYKEKMLQLGKTQLQQEK